jgi:hypothetical protein
MDLTEYTKDTLRGLIGVVVVIETIKPDAEADGLSISELQTDVELKLVQGGIRVLPHSEWCQTPGRPWLYVSVNTIKHLGSYFFSVDVQLKQDVNLPHQPSIVTSSATWELGSIGFAKTDLLRAKIRESVGAYVDNFINDYSAVNYRPH